MRGDQIGTFAGYPVQQPGLYIPHRNRRQIGLFAQKTLQVILAHLGHHLASECQFNGIVSFCFPFDEIEQVVLLEKIKVRQGPAHRVP